MRKQWRHVMAGCGAVLALSSLRAQTPQSINGNVYNAVFGASDKIYVSAEFTATNGQSYQGNFRLNSNGSIDTTFAADLTNPAVSFGVLGDGSLLANSPALVTKYTSTGSLIGSFGPIFDSRALVVSSGGTAFYTGGGVYSSSTGLLQVSFGANGIDANALSVQANGAVILGGTDGTLLRVNADGTLDGSFHAPAEIAGGTIHGLSVQGDGKIIVSGSGFASGVNVMRLNANGTVDGTFSAATTANGPAYSLSDGTTLISTGSNGTQISFDSSGRIVTAISTAAAAPLVRLTSTGALYSTQPSIVSGFESLADAGLGVFTLSAIPEPTTYAVLAGVAALAMAGWRRWRV